MPYNSANHYRHSGATSCTSPPSRSWCTSCSSGQCTFSWSKGNKHTREIAPANNTSPTSAMVPDEAKLSARAPLAKHFRWCQPRLTQPARQPRLPDLPILRLVCPFSADLLAGPRQKVTPPTSVRRPTPHFSLAGTMFVQRWARGVASAARNSCAGRRCLPRVPAAALASNVACHAPSWQVFRVPVTAAIVAASALALGT